MDRHELLQENKIDTRFRLPSGNVLTNTGPQEKASGTQNQASTTPQDMGFFNYRWMGWAFVYAYVLFIFSFGRSASLKTLIKMYGGPQDNTLKVKLAIIGLGFLEDFVVTTYFACALWLFDSFRGCFHRRLGRIQGAVATMANILMFLGSWFLFFVVMAPFAADMMLVANRNMRFTSELVAALIKERQHLKAAPIAPEEVHRGYVAGISVVVEATLFAAIRTRSSWADLARWNPTHVMPTLSQLPLHAGSGEGSLRRIPYNPVPVEDERELSGCGDEDDENNKVLLSQRALLQNNKMEFRSVMKPAIISVGLIFLPAIVAAVARTCSPLVVYSALNAGLNESLGKAFQPAPSDALFKNLKDGSPWVEAFIHSTERHKLFNSSSLYRRTTGFSGDLAFDVSVVKANPPNVLVIGVESFRFQDSLYLVGEDDPSNLLNGTNITITPNFDRWAKRGVAFRNMWSSLPTSRSLESLLFAQIPYESTVQTGISGGRKHTKLFGLPQFFTSKGYETFFTTGSSITFDGWEIFLAAHGFDTVWSNIEMLKLAKNELNITKDQWFGPEHRGFEWGVHDDLSFKFLGDLLLNKTKEQATRVANGEEKRPLFHTHYTISSHAPFAASPTWYAEMDKPDFSSLYEGHKHAAAIKRYLELRYFTDMELGKFMDRMTAEGVLNDTIVVIVGDHGQAPEASLWNLHEDSVRRVASAIVAEGRLGDSVGLLLDDACEHYDMLNTLADITGVPEGGFLQHGVGRSLKRNVPFGERVVFANDPGYKMSIIRGHQRLRYDGVIDSMFVHDTEADHYCEMDLFPGLSPKEQTEWETWRDNGRKITAYYKQRWDEKCFSNDCPDEGSK